MKYFFSITFFLCAVIINSYKSLGHHFFLKDNLSLCEEKVKIKFNNLVNSLVDRTRSQIYEDLFVENGNNFRVKIIGHYKYFSSSMLEIIDDLDLDLEDDIYLSYSSLIWLEILGGYRFVDNQVLYNDSDESLLDILLTNSQINDKEEKISVLIEKGLLFVPRSGDFFYLSQAVTTYKKIYDYLLIQISYSDNWVGLLSCLVTTEHYDEDIYVESSMHVIKDNNDIYFKKYHRDIFGRLLVKGDFKKVGHFFDCMCLSNIPLVIEDFSHAAPPFFDIPLLFDTLEYMCKLRSSMDNSYYDFDQSKLIIDNPLDEFLDYFFYSDPFGTFSPVNLSGIFEKNRFANRFNENICSYINSGKIRNLLLMEIGKLYIAPIIEKRNSVFIMEFIRYLNSSMSFLSELRKYHGFDHFFLLKNRADNLFHKALMLKNIPIIGLIFFVISNNKYLFEGNNIFHLALLFNKSDTDFYPQVDERCCRVLNIFLCSSKMERSTIVDLLKSKNNDGLTPLEIAAKNGYMLCFDTIQDYLKES